MHRCFRVIGEMLENKNPDKKRLEDECEVYITDVQVLRNR